MNACRNKLATDGLQFNITNQRRVLFLLLIAKEAPLIPAWQKPPPAESRRLAHGRDVDDGCYRERRERGLMSIVDTIGATLTWSLNIVPIP